MNAQVLQLFTIYEMNLFEDVPSIHITRNSAADMVAAELGQIQSISYILFDNY